MKLIHFYFKKILTNEISAKHTFYPGVRHLNFVIFKIVLAMPVCCCAPGVVCRCAFSVLVQQLVAQRKTVRGYVCAYIYIY